MKIRQYSYFELASTIVSAAELTIRLGVEPDQLAVKGTTNARGRVCRLHSWRISDDLGGAVDEQLERLIVRLEPGRTQLTALASDADVWSRMASVGTDPGVSVLDCNQPRRRRVRPQP
ncbi:DUF4279 domain-containing protein [Nocardia salmonicida]|uniref:DUF4279 domain-containing protein n=1 Tax=Nocardia salmonicida TaxID=53431 RepID=UPI00371DD133